MIDVSLSSLKFAVPEIRDARYDFGTGTFRAADGRILDDKYLDRAAASARGARKASVGRNSIKRAILLQSLARAESSQKSGLLDYALRKPGQLVTPALKGVLYSRTAAPGIPGPFERAAPTEQAEAAREADAVDLATSLSESDPSTVAGRRSTLLAANPS